MPGLAHHLAFTDRQRNVLVVLLVIGVVYAGARWAMQPARVSDPQPESGARAPELADRIDPEYADWQTLAILPGIGEAKAREIIAKREERQRLSPQRRAFQKAEDLYYVKGIGGATVEKLKPYLMFPEPTATSPADRMRN